MLEVDEAWFQMDSPSGSVLYLAFDLATMPMDAAPLSGGGFLSSVNGAESTAFEFVATIKGKAIYRASQASPEHDRDRRPRRVELVSRALLTGSI